MLQTDRTTVRLHRANRFTNGRPRTKSTNKKKSAFVTCRRQNPSLLLTTNKVPAMTIDTRHSNQLYNQSIKYTVSQCCHKFRDLRAHDDKLCTHGNTRSQQTYDCPLLQTTREDEAGRNGKLSLERHRRGPKRVAVMQKLRNLKADKSPGPDGIHPMLRKSCADVVAEPLSLIYQASFDVGNIPQDWPSHSPRKW